MSEDDTELRDWGLKPPCTDEMYYWSTYVEAGNEAFKLNTTIFPDYFSVFEITPFHKRANEWNMFDIRFTPTLLLPDDGAIVLELPTHNE